MVQTLWKTLRKFFKKLIIDLSHDPAIPLVGIYPKNMRTRIQKDICTPMLPAALFTIVKLEKQLKCPFTDEWRRKTWYMSTMGSYSAIRKDDVLPFVTTWMHLVVIRLNEMSQTEKDKY